MRVYSSLSVEKGTLSTVPGIKPGSFNFRPKSFFSTTIRTQGNGTKTTKLKTLNSYTFLHGPLSWI